MSRASSSDKDQEKIFKALEKYMRKHNLKKGCILIERDSRNPDLFYPTADFEFNSISLTRPEE